MLGVIDYKNEAPSGINGAALLTLTGCDRPEMAAVNLPPNRFYVYALYREDGVTPFYIGKGSGRRCYQHIYLSLQGERSHKASVIRKILRNGGDILVKKLADNLTHEEAIFLEIEKIAAIGRYPDGPLTNATRGGDGLVNPSADVRARIGAKSRINLAKPEIKKKISDALRGRTLSQEHRDNIGRGHLGKKHSAKWRKAQAGWHHTEKSKEAIASKRRGSVHTEESLIKMRKPRSEQGKINMRGIHRSSEARNRMSESAKGRRHTDLTRQRMSAAHTGVPKSQQHRDNLKLAWDYRREAIAAKAATEAACQEQLYILAYRRMVENGEIIE